MILAIDFDGVIHNPNDREPGKRMGKPVPGAKQALEQLVQAGHSVIVHSVKAQTASGEQAIHAWMDYFQMPRHEVTAVKPNADAYIDDRAIHFSTWPLVLDIVAEWQENGSA